MEHQISVICKGMNWSRCSCCGLKWLLAIFVVDVSSFVSVASMQSVLCLLCFYCIVYKLILVKNGLARNLIQDLLYQ